MLTEGILTVVFHWPSDCKVVYTLIQNAHETGDNQCTIFPIYASIDLSIITHANTLHVKQYSVRITIITPNSTVIIP